MKVAGFGLALCALALSVVAQPAQASPLQQNREKARALAAEVTEFDARIEVAVQRYSEATQRLDEVRTAIQRNRRDLRGTRYELAVARQLLTMRAVAIYKQEDVSSIDVVLGASDFGELVGQMEIMRRVVRSDTELVRSVTRTQRELDEREAKLEADLSRAEKLVAERESEYQTIHTELGHRRALLAGVRAEIRSLVRKQAAAAAAKRSAPTVTPPSQPSGGSDQWWPLIHEAADANGVSATGMYRLMMIESGGFPTIVGPGGYKGLFQYAPSTWRGAWNPWRNRSILDGSAQVRATALALHLGYGPAWWGSTYAWAFGDD